MRDALEAVLCLWLAAASIFYPMVLSAFRMTDVTEIPDDLRHEFVQIQRGDFGAALWVALWSLTTGPVRLVLMLCK